VALVLDHHLEPLAKFFSVDVEEIQATKFGHLWLWKVGGVKTGVKVPELTREWWFDLLSILAHRQDRTQDVEENPRVSVMLDQGHRVQLNMGNHVWGSGLSAVIRLKHPRLYKLADYNPTKTQLARLEKAVRDKDNILISGGPGAGKTGFANALCERIDEHERVVVIEDAPELDLGHIENQARFKPTLEDSKEKVTYLDLMNDVVRSTPERLMVGELRLDNTWLVLRALNVGQDGFIGTIHANTPEDAFEAIEVNVLLAGVQVDRRTLESVLHKKFDLVVQIRKDPKTGKRFLSDMRDLRAEREKGEGR
jgi:Flp pilus assembly CpaF family ATPase